MSGLIIKEYQIYCKNYKDCHQWAVLTANTPIKEAIKVAIKQGWKRQGSMPDLWVCPKCLKKDKTCKK